MQRQTPLHFCSSVIQYNRTILFLSTLQTGILKIVTIIATVKTAIIMFTQAIQIRISFVIFSPFFN